MTSKQFNNIVDDQVGTCVRVLCAKAEEYAVDTDRLHNFKVAADLQNKTPIQALSGMMAKHTVSIYDMCEQDGIKTFDADLWDEKITDSINYLLLLKALVAEQHEI